jgi:hypothetical protein
MGRGMNTKTTRTIVRFGLISVLALNGACATDTEEAQDEATQVEAKDEAQGSEKDQAGIVPQEKVQPKMMTTYDLKAAKK